MEELPVQRMWRAHPTGEGHDRNQLFLPAAQFKMPTATWRSLEEVLSVPTNKDQDYGDVDNL